MTVLAIPDPSLVVLIGAAGSGKTTFAARHFDPTEVLSSDRYRALVAGDEADQRATGPAFARLHRDLERRLGARRLTVIDATNVERSARRELLTRSRSAGMTSVAIVLDLPALVVIARNAGRAGRVVDESIVRRHLGRVRSLLDDPGPGLGLADEGFGLVVVIREPAELDAILIERVD